MNLTAFSLNRRVVVFAAIAIIAFSGFNTFQNMSRREDPEMLIRTCVVITQWPGAPAKKVEELVTDPLEKEIRELAEVKTVKSDSLTGQSIIMVELEDQYSDLDQIWDKVRVKALEAQPNLPQGCGTPFVNSDFGDVYAVVLAVRQAPPSKDNPGSKRYSYRELEIYAEKMRDQLKTLDSVAKVQFYGIPKEVIAVEVQSSLWAKLGLTADQLGKQLGARNIVESGGSLDTRDGRYPIVPSGEFSTEQQMGEVLVGRLPSGVPIRLKDIAAELRRDYEWPPRHIARFRGQDEAPERCVILSISMKGGRNIVTMGEEIEGSVKSLIGQVVPPDLRVDRVNDLPRQVDTKVQDFVSNLGQSILIVLVVAWLFMGWRPSLVMAAAIPLSMIGAILVVAQMGVELEQFSIASLIIALGMVVDNAIVVSDNIVRLLKEGYDKKEAALKGATELAIPLLASTGTTVAAFFPLAFMSGGAGEYIRSLPIVVSVTLIASYIVAMCVTPLMCMSFLKVPKDSSAQTVSRPGRAYESVVLWCLHHKAVVLIIAFVGFIASLNLIPLIGSQFFPSGERDQFFIDIWLPEGTPIEATDRKVKQVMELIHETREREMPSGKRENALVNAIAFVGGQPPRMSLTMETEQSYSNYANLVVNTTDPKISSAWAKELAVRVKEIAGVDITVRTAMLGPLIKYPVEFRLIGEDDAVLRAKGEEMLEVLRKTKGTQRVWTNWGNSSPQVSIDVNSEAANLAGVSNLDVAQSLNSLISGRRLTTFNEGTHKVPVVLRLRQEERRRLDDLAGMSVTGRNGKVPLSAFADVQVSWQPAKISRRGNRRTLTIAARVLPGELPNTVTQRAYPKLKKILATLPPSYELQVGGEQEETAKANDKIGGSFLIGFFLIILVLILQYNSLIKPAVILATVPLALIGALIGLYTSGWALGFMPNLGIVSLAGIVINNAIVLVDFIESKVAEGEDLYSAVAGSGRIRMKPIVLTTLTTIGGMLPLALFAGPMWAGMAWAVIFGLALSTVLTLLVVPSLFVAMVEIFGLKVGGVDLKERAAQQVQEELLSGAAQSNNQPSKEKGEERTSELETLEESPAPEATGEQEPEESEKEEGPAPETNEAKEAKEKEAPVSEETLEKKVETPTETEAEAKDETEVKVETEVKDEDEKEASSDKKDSESPPESPASESPERPQD